MSNELAQSQHQLERSLQNWIHTRPGVATTTLPESLNQKISQFLQNSLPAILMMLVGN